MVCNFFENLGNGRNNGHWSIVVVALIKNGSFFCCCSCYSELIFENGSLYFENILMGVCFTKNGSLFYENGSFFFPKMEFVLRKWEFVFLENGSLFFRV